MIWTPIKSRPLRCFQHIIEVVSVEQTVTNDVIQNVKHVYNGQLIFRSIATIHVSRIKNPQSDLQQYNVTSFISIST